jgi:hypothetical protein
VVRVFLDGGLENKCNQLLVNSVHRPNSTDYISFVSQYLCLLMLDLVISDFIVKKLTLTIFLTWLFERVFTLSINMKLLLLLCYIVLFSV